MELDLASRPRAVAYLRLGYGAVAFLTPKVATVAIGGRPSQMTPAAMGWAAVFGTRDMALGVLTLGTENCDPGGRRKALLLAGAVDTTDAVAMVMLARRTRSIFPLLLGAAPALASGVVHILAARQLSGAPTEADVRDTSVYATA